MASEIAEQIKWAVTVRSGNPQDFGHNMGFQLYKHLDGEYSWWSASPNCVQDKPWAKTALKIALFIPRFVFTAIVSSVLLTLSSLYSLKNSFVHAFKGEFKDAGFELLHNVICKMLTGGLSLLFLAGMYGAVDASDVD